MPGGAINIIIGGNAQQLAQAAGQAKTSLEGIGSAANVAAAGLQRLPSEIVPAGRGLGNMARDAQAAGSALKAIPPAAGPAGRGIGSVGAAAASSASGLTASAAAANAATAAFKRTQVGANSAGFALTNVGRVAQDLPFGFIGIQNNLNPLLESFQRLRAETGSNRAALKALGSSLTGVGGIGLALSIVSSAIVIFQNGISGFNKKTKEAKESSDELAKSIRSIALIQGEAVAGVQGQIAQVSALARVVSDSNKPYDERKRALQELKEVNKAYFGDLQLEDAATGKLTATIQEYTKALINNAIQKTFVDEIAQIAKKIAENDEAISKSRDRLGRSTSDLAKAEANLNNNSGINARTGDVSTAAAKADEARREAIANLADAQNGLNVLNDTSTRLTEQKLLLENRVNAAVAEGLKFKRLQNDGTEKETDALKARIAALKEIQGLGGLDRSQQILLAQLEVQLVKRDGVKLGFTQEEIQQQIDAIIEKAFPVKTFNFKLEKILLEPKTVDVASNIDVAGGILKDNKIPLNAFDALIEALRKAAEVAKGKAEEIAIDIKSFLASTLASAFESIGEGIANAFQGGGLQGVIGPLIATIGEAITALGKAAIQAGVAALLLKKTLNAFIVKNPALVIAAGITAVALGTAIKNQFNNTKVPGFADGVTNFSGGAALVGERGPEIVTLPIGSNVIPNNPFAGINNIRLVSEIRGEDIYLSNRRVSGRRGRM